jgi:hypothetical protein
MSAMLKAIVSGEIHRVHRRPGRTAVFYRKRNSQRPLLVDDVVARGVEANSLKAETIAVWRVRRADFVGWYSGLSTNDLRPRIDIDEFWPDGLARGLIDQPIHEEPKLFRQTGKCNPTPPNYVMPPERHGRTWGSLRACLLEYFPSGVPESMPLPDIRKKIGGTRAFKIRSLDVQKLKRGGYDMTLKRLLGRTSK